MLVAAGFGAATSALLVAGEDAACFGGSGEGGKDGDYHTCGDGCPFMQGLECFAFHFSGTVWMVVFVKAA
jgi:hypothetical protein